MQDLYVKERERSRIPARYQWDLSDVYSSDEEWAEAKRMLIAGFSAIPAFQGTLSESPARLLQCLEQTDLLNKECMRLACYASMMSDADTRESKYLAMDQEMGQIGSDLSALASFIEPEILKIGREKILQFMDQEPRLAVYRHILDDMLRKKDHTRSEGEEKIIAEANLMADSPANINTIFTNADFPFPEATLQDGSTIRLDQAAFSLHRRSSVREDRMNVFAAYLGKLNEFRRTLGAQLAAQMRKDMFFARVRAYPSCLERALDTHNIPVAVYRSLIDGVHAHLDTLHRCLRIRKKLLGLDELHYYDLYAPVVKELELNYSFDEAVGHVLDSLAPLGKRYVGVVTWW